MLARELWDLGKCHPVGFLNIIKINLSDSVLTDNISDNEPKLMDGKGLCGEVSKI